MLPFIGLTFLCILSKCQWAFTNCITWELNLILTSYLYLFPISYFWFRQINIRRQRICKIFILESEMLTSDNIIVDLSPHLTVSPMPIKNVLASPFRSFHNSLLSWWPPWIWKMSLFSWPWWVMLLRFVQKSVNPVGPLTLYCTERYNTYPFFAL